MADFPLLNFEMYNPVEAGVNAFGKTTQGMSDLFKANETRAKLPYASQNAANEAKMKKLEAALYEDMKRADIAHKESIVKHNEYVERTGPRIGPGIAGQYEAYQRAAQAGDTQQADLIMQGIVATIGSRTTPSERILAKTPMDAKKQEGAILQTMGFSPIEATKWLASGKSMYDAGAAKGLSKEEVDEIFPSYAATTFQIRQNQDRIGREAENQVLNDFIVPAVSHYLGPGANVFGFSPKQVYDAVRGKNKKEQSRFLAAYSLSLDKAANNLKLGAGIAGIQAIQAQQAHSFNTLRARLPYFDAEVWADAQNMAQETLSKGAKAYARASTKSGEFMNAPDKNEEMVEAVQGNLAGEPDYDSMSVEELKALLDSGNY